jgi:type IV secretion system protein VirD4
VLRWEPAAIGNTIAWNPLAEVRLGSDYEFRDVSNIMEAIADPDGRGLEGHWDPTAATLLTGVALHVLYERQAAGARASLADVAQALDDPGRDPPALYRAMVENTFRDGGTHPQIARIGAQQLHREVKERASVHSTASRFMRVFHDPVVARSTAHSDVTIHQIMNHAQPVSLYIVTRGEDKLRMRPLVRLFLTLAMTRLSSADIPANAQAAPHRHRLLFCIDEFASLRRLEAFADAMARCAGYGIKVFLATQDREQILDAYGPHETITSHCHVRIGYAPTNLGTAEWMSKMTGVSTVVTEDIAENAQRGSLQEGFSRAMRSVSRPLLTPDEVMRLPMPRKDRPGRVTAPGQALVFVAGRPPALVEQAYYFLDAEFRERVALPAPPTHRLRPV